MDEMLFLRGSGWSYTALAEAYDCPKLTIRFLARKYGLTGDTIVTQFSRQDYLRTTTNAIQEGTMSHTEPDGKINEGKTYQEYVQEEKERKRKRLIDHNELTTRTI